MGTDKAKCRLQNWELGRGGKRSEVGGWRPVRDERNFSRSQKIALVVGMSRWKTNGLHVRVNVPGEVKRRENCIGKRVWQSSL